MSQIIEVRTICGEVWESDSLDRPMTMCACLMQDGRYASTTVAEAIALVALSDHAADVDYASARVETGRNGVRLVRFDLRR